MRTQTRVADVWTSDATRRFVHTAAGAHRDERAEMELVRVYPEFRGQSIIGFGGAITEAAASVYAGMPDETRQALIAAYFGPEGNAYTLCRTHVQSCDFSLGSYTYLHRPWDRGIRHFSLSRDLRYLVPMLRDATAADPRLQLLASPWSPPSWMKTNHLMRGGGHLKPGYRRMWAHMLARYAAEYRALGLPVTRMTLQNEPQARQLWESCLMSASDEVALARELRPALDAQGLTDVRILMWDHNKERIIDRCLEAFGTREMQTDAEDAAEAQEARVVDGVAFHWYTGDHFEALREAARRWPDREFIMTEGCCEFSREEDDEVRLAEHYAHDLIGDLEAGVRGWIDWNILLDAQGGPNHTRNFCSSPIWFDGATGELHLTASYSWIGHVTRFVQPGAVHLLTSRYTGDIETTSFENPDGSHVCVLLDRFDWPQDITLYEEGWALPLHLEPHSVTTVRWIPDAQERQSSSAAICSDATER